jgi:hypothetical protein
MPVEQRKLVRMGRTSFSGAIRDRPVHAPGDQLKQGMAGEQARH